MVAPKAPLLSRSRTCQAANAETFTKDFETVVQSRALNQTDSQISSSDPRQSSHHQNEFLKRADGARSHGTLRNAGAQISLQNARYGKMVPRCCMNNHLSPSLCLPLHLIPIPTDSNTISQISALTGIGQPEFAGNLYTFLVAQPNYATTEARQALVRRLREALVKSVSIVGVCRPMEAIFSIDAVERAEDKDYSSTRYATNSFLLSFLLFG